MVEKKGRNWDLLVPYVFFAIREAPQAIEEEVEKMLRDGIIKESTSPWSSPIIVVLKPDDTLSLWNNFQHLNQVSDFDCYLFPTDRRRGGETFEL